MLENWRGVADLQLLFSSYQFRIERKRQYMAYNRRKHVAFWYRKIQTKLFIAAAWREGVPAKAWLHNLYVLIFLERETNSWKRERERERGKERERQVISLCFINNTSEITKTTWRRRGKACNLKGWRAWHVFCLLTCGCHVSSNINTWRKFLKQMSCKTRIYFMIL